MKCDTWHVVWVNILSKFQLRSSYGLGETILWRYFHNGPASNLINEEGVCRTAPAKPGLSNRKHSESNHENYFEDSYVKYGSACDIVGLPVPQLYLRREYRCLSIARHCLKTYEMAKLFPLTLDLPIPGVHELGKNYCKFGSWGKCFRGEVVDGEPRALYTLIKCILYWKIFNDMK